MTFRIDTYAVTIQPSEDALGPFVFASYREARLALIQRLLATEKVVSARAMKALRLPRFEEPKDVA